jgi:hypothetical protein
VSAAPADLQVAPNDDPDGFLVWNDDIYGDRDGDLETLPELPVSRVPIPCGDVQLALQATTTAAAPGSAWSGIRDIKFDCAQDLWVGNLAQPAQAMLVSPVAVANTATLTAQRKYVVLHGRSNDGTAFSNTNGNPVMTVGGLDAVVPDLVGSVVFASCCWGGLVVDQIASSNQPAVPRTVAQSIALKFLSKGVRAFIGFTGAHWLPLEEPFGHFGIPLHDRFWHHHLNGDPPAKALFKAKRDYVTAIPHFVPNVINNDHTLKIVSAKELKTFWSATCLGLGW